MKLLKDAIALTKTMMEYRRFLHGNAETGFDLIKTKEYVRKQLTDMGLSPMDCGKAGLTATIPGDGGKVILLRADMDALPIREETGASFSCIAGNMHACGHDMHTAMLLGAAKILQDRKLPGTVKLMFQPAEELLLGAKDMMNAGVLESPVPDAAVMIHVTTGSDIPVGTVILPPEGVITPAADTFSVTVHGHGCHGSTPHKGINALTAAAQILLALQQLPAQEISADSPAVLSVGKLVGGNAANAVADLAVLEGTIRCFDKKTQETMKFRIKEIASAIATANRATAEVAFPGGCPPFLNDGKLRIVLKEAIKEYLPEVMILNSPTRNLSGSEDFAYISQDVPSIMVTLAAGEPEHGFTYPQHHPKTDFDETALAYGAAIYAAAALGFLT